MTTILVIIHFIVAKLNNTIQKNKRNQEYIPIHDQIDIFSPVARPIHYPSHTQHQELTLFKPARTIRAEAERNGSAFSQGIDRSEAEALLSP